MELTINQILELAIIAHRNGNIDEAENLYRQILTIQPMHAKSHNNLGVLSNFRGRIEEAEKSFKKAIELKPDYAEAHFNLANKIANTKKFEEAEKIYRKAIELKPDYAAAYFNLGNTQKKLGKLDETEISYKKVVALKPDYAQAHYNLGVTLKGLKKLNDAEVSFKQAIILKSDYVEAYNNLGVILQKQGRLHEAEVILRKAIVLKPGFVEAIFNLSLVMDFLNNLEESIILLEKIIKINKNNQVLKAKVDLAIYRFLENNFSESKKLLLANQKINEETFFDFKNYKVYQEYLLKILSLHEKKTSTFNFRELEKKLYVIGESHSLVSHGLNIQTSGKDFLCVSFLIKGCKQSDLGSNNRNSYKYKFNSIFNSLPKQSKVLLTIGEIDCRLDNGILKYINNYPQKKIIDLITNTVENYLDYVFKLNSSAEHVIIIQGVPCPNINTKDISAEKVVELINMIRDFNKTLKRISKKKGFGFLDVHKLTDNGVGFSNNIWHLDAFHLSPEAMLEAWREHTSLK
jgi:tetratricopeptide (TPR) repeat protein